MARKDPQTPAIRSEQLAAHYQALLAQFEAGATERPITERAKDLLVLARVAAALSGAEAAEHRAETALLRAKTARRREDAAVAKAQRLLRACDPDFNMDEGDEMDMNDGPSDRNNPEYVERLRRQLEGRFSEFTVDMDKQGLLDGLLELANPANRGKLVQPGQPRAEAA